MHKRRAENQEPRLSQWKVKSGELKMKKSIKSVSSVCIKESRAKNQEPRLSQWKVKSGELKMKKSIKSVSSVCIGNRS